MIFKNRLIWGIAVLFLTLFGGGILNAQMTLTIGTGTVTQNYVPIFQLYNTSAGEMLFTAEEMQGSKQINSVAWHKTGGGTVPINGVSIYMKHSTATSLPTGTYSATDYVLVWTGTITNNANGWITMPLTTPFIYNGTDNLQILVVHIMTTWTGGPNWTSTTTTPNMARAYWSDPTPPAPNSSSLTSQNGRPNTQFGYVMPGPMAYETSMAIQPLTTPVMQGYNNQMIIGVKVTTTGSETPINLTGLTFNTNGTTSTSDITNAKVFYTGSSATFNAVNQFGADYGYPDGTFNFTGEQLLMPGHNYFWLVYDIPYEATLNNILNAECTEVVVAEAPYVPSITAPGPGRPIMAPLDGIYTIGVDPEGNPGNFPTLTAAVGALNSLGMGGTTSFSIISDIVEPGQVTITPWLEYGTGGYYLTIQSNGELHSISASPAANEGVIRLLGADRVNILGEGFEGMRSLIIQSTSAAATVTHAIKLESTGDGCRNNTISGCILRANSNTAASAGVYINGTDNDNNSILNNQIVRAYYGIYAWGVSTTERDTNIIIQNNLIGSLDNPADRIGLYGIYMWYFALPIINNNEIVNIISATSSVNGIYAYYVESPIITNNKIYGLNSTYAFGYPTGIYIGYECNAAQIINNDIHNLTSSGYNSTYQSLSGICLYGGTGHNIQFNSIHLFGTATTVGAKSACLWIPTYNTVTNNSTIKNNVFANGITGDATSSAYIYVAVSGTIFTNTNYNTYYYYNANGKMAWRGNDILDLAAWRAGNAGQDLQSAFGDPLFVSDIDLHIGPASPAMYTGIADPLVTVDILGNPRPAVPCMGAYEFVGGDNLMPPVLLTPVNAKTGVSILTTFSWTEVTDAANYWIQISTTSDFTDIILDVNGIGASYMPDPALGYLTQYYWRAKAYNDTQDGYWSQVFHFTTTVEALAIPLQVSPLTETGGLIAPVIVSWLPADGATSYEVVYSTSPLLDVDPLYVSNIVGTSTSLTGLGLGVTWYWAVRAISEEATTEWSEIWNFTTAVVVQIGNGTAYNTSTGYPAPYGRFYWRSKHQMLITAAEIMANGGTVGFITSLGFNVQAVNTCDMMPFTIKMKQTTAAVLSGTFDAAGFTTVYSGNYQPVVGWNNHQFTAPFMWDGISNILIETCHDNNTTYTQNASMYYTPTTLLQTMWVNQDNTPTTCASTTGSTSLNRPNMLFGWIPSPIPMPMLIAPANNAAGVSVTPTFEWSIPEEGATYQFQLSLTSSFAELIVDASGLVDAMYTPELPLDPTVEYFWRVMAFNADGEQSAWSVVNNFYTDGPLTTPFLAAPLNETTDMIAPIIFDWDNVNAAGSYTLQVATDNAFASIILNAENITTSQYSATGLPLGATLYWRVQATNGVTNSEWSEVWSFSTAFVVQVGTGTVINSYYPSPYSNYYWGNKQEYLVLGSELLAGGAMPGQLSSIAFDVTTVSITSPIANYRIRIKPTTLTTLTGYDTEGGWTEVFNAPIALPTLGWNVTPFTNTYVWDGASNIIVEICAHNVTNNYTVSYVHATTTTNIMAIYGYNSSTYTATFCEDVNPTGYTASNRPNMLFGLTPGGFGAPTLLTPIVNANPVAALPTFTWNPGYGAESYELQISTTTSFEETVFSGTATGTSFTLETALLPTTGYYWRMRSIAGEETSMWTGARYFITEGPLAYPWLLSPMNGLNYVSPGLLRWDPVLGAIYYRIEIATDYDFLELVATGDSLVGTNADVSTVLAYNTMYYWRVMARRLDQTSEWSEIWQFTTMNPTLVNTTTYSFTNEVAEYVEFTDGTIVPPFPSMDDGGQWIYSPFNFLYAGGLYTDVYITTNGFINLGNANATLGNDLASTTNKRVIAAMWEDNYVDDSSVVSYRTVGEEPNRIFEIQYKYVRHLGFSGGRQNYQYRLFENGGRIEVCYGPMVDATESWSATMGISGHHNNASSVLDFISVTPNVTDGTTTISDATSNNSITYPQIYITSGHKYIYEPGLAAPVLSTPENFTTGIIPPVEFTWFAVEEATSYGIQVANDPSFTDIEAEFNGIIDTYITIYGFVFNQTYYWRVRAFNGETPQQWSAVWNYSTGVDPNMPAPELVSPANLSINILYNPTVFEWTMVANALSYNIEIATDATFTNILFNENTTGTTISEVLSADTEYFWRVRSIGYDGPGEWSLANSFTTMSETLPPPQLISPSGIVQYPMLMDVPFNWTVVNNALNYHLQVATAEDFNTTSLLYDADVTTNSFDLQVPPNQQLFWRARAIGVNGPGLWSVTNSFELIPFITEAPVLITPANGATNVTTADPELGWTSLPFVTTYHLVLTNGPTTIIDLYVVNSIYPIPAGLLSYNTTYTWKVAGTNMLSIDGPWSSEFTFTTENPVIPPPANWDFTINEGNNSTIIVPVAINPQLPNRPFLAGDAVGVFYTGDDGELHCGGRMLWTNANNAITAYGDDDFTADKEGFAFGETYTYKIWDSRLGIEYNAQATYESGPAVYQQNGYSILSGLSIITSVTHNIQLNNAWNLISSYVNPTDNLVANIFNPIAANTIIVKNGAGQIYVPAQGINTINNWNINNGYYVYMSGAATLPIVGQEIVPQNNPISMPTGWNVISYLRNNPIDVAIGLNSITSNMIIAKNGAGQIYVPAYSINTMGNMLPGSGYLVYMSTVADLTYPANNLTGRIANSNELTPLASSLVSSVSNTGNNATMLLTVNGIADGNELGVWNVRGELVGSGRVHNSTVAITVWGDNQMTKTIEGIAEGEMFTVKALNTTTGDLSDVTVTNVSELTSGNANLIYRRDGIYMGKATLNSETATTMSLNVVPNPVVSIANLEISLANTGEYSVEIYNVSGERVYTETRTVGKSNTEILNLSVENFTNGVYTIILKQGTEQTSQKMVIVK